MIAVTAARAPGAASPGRRLVARAAIALVCASAVLSVAGGVAQAAPSPSDMLTYMPTEDVFSVHTPAQVDGYLADLAGRGIGQALLQMPRFKQGGTVKLPRGDRTMLPRWAERVTAFNAEHAAQVSVTAVFNGTLRKNGPDLELPATRANMVAAIEAVLATGVSGVQLDLEPFTASPGLLALLGEVRSAFARAGFHGRLSIVSPANTPTWSPAYLDEVSAIVDQLDPTYYDRGYASASAYEAWMKGSLAYYSANASTHARIVPVIPSYSANRWHAPSVESVATASVALGEALAAGGRINGAGIWWWWGFFYDENGRYDASADRAAWQATTLGLPFSP